MEGDSGKCIAVDTKLRVNNFTYKRALCHNSRIWTTDKKDALKLSAVRMRFLKPTVRPCSIWLPKKR